MRSRATTLLAHKLKYYLNTYKKKDSHAIDSCEVSASDDLLLYTRYFLVAHEVSQH